MKTAAPVVTERAPAKISCEFAKLIYFWAKERVTVLLLYLYERQLTTRIAIKWDDSGSEPTDTQ
jgi:hypothetical protein